MDKAGFMTPEQAERSIWSYYYQLSQSRDRRSSPIMTEPPDQLTEEEVERLREQQLPWHRKAQLKALQLMQRRGGRISTALLKAKDRLFTEKAEREYFEDAMREAAQEHAADQDMTGRLDPNTGLPMSEADLQTGRGIVSGVDLCMEAIVPPRDLAEASTTWLPPCPAGEVEAEWGSKIEHWQALAFKPKVAACSGCGGRGIQRIKRKKTRGSRLVLIREDAYEFREVRCHDCGGRGNSENWDDDEHEAVKHNTRLIAQKIHDLAEEGYFDVRPIDDRDVEMGDLVWADKAGLTLGFRITWEGFQRMQEYVAEDPELQQSMHVLTLAGHDVRKSAPEWSQEEFRSTKPIDVTSGGFGIASGGNVKL